MTLTVKYVQKEHAAQMWPLVKTYIESAMEHGYGDYTLDQVKLLVCMGQWLLMVAMDEDKNIHGAATASFMNYPNDRVGFITFMGGKLITSQETFKQMCDILKQRGATKVQGMARPATARLWKRYGFNERSTLVETRI
jgi:hypothetical protein